MLTTARHLARFGFAVTVVGLYEADFGWSHQGLAVHPVLRSHRRRSVLGRVTRVFTDRIRLRNAIRRIHSRDPIDIVEWPDFEGLYLHPVPGIVDVVRNHGPIMSHRLYSLVPRQAHTEWFEMRTLRSIDNWIGVSTWFMNEWIRITGATPKRTIVLYNPVDCRVFRPAARRSESGLILYSGSLLERKGVFALARAARDFLPRLPNARLLFVGRDVTGTARARIRREVGEQLSHRVHFSDPVPQPQLAELLRQCTLFAMPSLLESFGNVWAEAMASGVPVLGSKLSCGPEIVPHGVAGLLVDPTDPIDVANRVVELMRDDALRGHLGAGGRCIALERYSTDVVLPATADFYRECVQE